VSTDLTKMMLHKMFFDVAFYCRISSARRSVKRGRLQQFCFIVSQTHKNYWAAIRYFYYD